MAEKTFTNPADEAWDVNLAWENTEVDGSGDLAVVSGESEGWRASNGWDPELGAVVDSSLVEWTATGDAGGEVAVSETDPTSLRLDGEDDYVRFKEGSVNPKGPVSVVFWFRTIDSDSWIFNDYNSSFEGLICRVQNDVISWFIRDLDGTTEEISGPAITDDVWHLFVGTFDSNGEMVLYIDAVEEAFKSTTLSNDAGGTHENGPGFSTYLLDRRYIYGGYISNARIYNRAISLTEVNDLYNHIYINNGLIHHWKLDEGTGSTAYDSAGSNDGTITGASWRDGESPLYRPATSGQPIPGVSQGDDLSGKKIYGRQKLNASDATMQSFTLQVSTAEEVANIAAWRRMTTIGSGTH